VQIVAICVSQLETLGIRTQFPEGARVYSDEHLVQFAPEN
jgi:hypothetical protein